MAKIDRNYLHAVVSGVLMAIGYSFSGMGFLLWFGLVPLFWGLNLIRKDTPRETAPFVYGLTFGSIYFLTILRWFWGLFPLNGVGLDYISSFLLVLIIWIITGVGLAIFPGIFCLIFVKYFRKNHNFILTALVIASLFVLLDFLRSYAIGIIWYGSGTLIGPHWTIGNFAYGLSGSQIILRLASYSGIYGILFLIILSNHFFYRLIRRSKFSKLNKLLLPILSATILILFVSLTDIDSSQTSPNSTKQVSFSVIQTKQEGGINEGAEELLSNFKTQSKMFQEIPKQSIPSDIIIFPEGSNFFTNLSSFVKPSQLRKYFAKLFDESRLVIDNSRIHEKDGSYSRVTLLSTKEDIAGYYDKKLLTPGGEFFPYIPKFFGYILAKDKLKNYENASRLEIGIRDRPANFMGLGIGIAVCSELLSPSLIREKSRNNNLLIGMSSTAIFRGNQALINQLLSINKFRSAENHIPLIFAANYGLSYNIDALGNLTKIAPDDEPRIFTGESVSSYTKSWYNKVGDWPILICSILIIFLYFWFSRRNTTSD